MLPVISLYLWQFAPYMGRSLDLVFFRTIWNFISYSLHTFRTGCIRAGLRMRFLRLITERLAQGTGTTLRATSRHAVFIVNFP